MKIRYRDRHGRLISVKQAKTRKSVVSEIYDEKTGKRIGKSVSGYYSEVKKLARDAMPKVSPKKQKQYTPRTTPKKSHTTYYSSDADFDDDPDEDYLDELEEHWDDIFEDDFGELDEYFDDLESLLEDDSEWYTHE